jgi:Undecaprenyl-phosphate glucose phosphotransferase
MSKQSALATRQGDKLLVHTLKGGLFRSLLRPNFVEKLFAAVDFLLIVAAGLVSGFGYQWLNSALVANWGSFLGAGAFVAWNFVAIMHLKLDYQFKNLTSIGKQLRDLIVAWPSLFGLLAAIGFSMKISSDFSRGATFLFFSVGGTSLVIWRFFIVKFVSQALDNEWFAKRDIIVVAEKGKAISSSPLFELARHGFRPIRIFEISKIEMEAMGICSTLIDKLSELILLAQNHNIKDVYLLIGWHNRRVIEGIVQILTILPISIHLIPDDNTARFLGNPVTNIGATWATELAREPLTFTERATKRCLDLVLASLALVILWPLMLLTALLIKFDSRGPVIFVQKRNGFGGHAFNIFKFRSMSVQENGPVVRQTIRNDPRVTTLGRWVRRSSIDELPQLFNVLAGHMSLVGPRPHAVAHNSEYEQRIATYAFRHHVKPGITGWAQIKGYRGETNTLDLMQRRVEHDLWYINNWSLALDIRILVQTVFVSLSTKSAY